MKRKIALLLTALGLSVAATTACYPVPTWGPGSPGYSCFNIQHTVWLSERPAVARYASFTVGATVCEMWRSTILSAVPYQKVSKMGVYAPLMNAGEDNDLRVDWLNSHSFEIEGGSYGQLCLASKYIGFTCSFMDHVHGFLYYTVPGAIGINGPYWTTDRGDISMWSTP